MWFITKAHHREYVEDFARSWTNFMLETLVGTHLKAAGIHHEYNDVIAKRLNGEELLSHWMDVEQILAFNGVWPLSGRRTDDTEAFLELVSPMEFYCTLNSVGLKLGRKSTSSGDVIEFQLKTP